MRGASPVLIYRACLLVEMLINTSRARRRVGERDRARRSRADPAIEQWGGARELRGTNASAVRPVFTFGYYQTQIQILLLLLRQEFVLILR